MDTEHQQQRTRLDIDAIQARADAASPAPWDGGHLYDPLTGEGLFGAAAADYVRVCVSAAPADAPFYGVTCGHPDGGLADVCHTGNGPGSRANTDFIRHAREDVPALVAEVRALRSEAEEYGAQFHRLVRVVKELDGDGESDAQDACPVADVVEETLRKFAAEVRELREALSTLAYEASHYDRDDMGCPIESMREAIAAARAALRRPEPVDPLKARQ